MSTKTTIKTTTVGNVVTVVTTVTTPGQPTRTTTTKTTKVPAGQQPADVQRMPAQLDQPLPQGRTQQQQQQQQFEPRKSGFFSTLKTLPKRSSSFFQKNPGPAPVPAPAPAPQQQQQQQRPLPIPAPVTQQQQRPTPAPVPQQQQQQRPIPAPVLQQQQQQRPIPAPVLQQQQQRPIPVPVPQQQQRPIPTVDPVDNLAQKVHQVTLNRPPVVQNGVVVLEDSIAQLKRSQPLLAPNFAGQRLDVNSIDFSREDAHARACPSSEASTIARLSHYLTSPCTGDKVSQLRTIFTWIADNIAYNVPGFLTGNYGDQTAEGVLRNRYGVCEGYSNLFIALAEPAGLEVQKVIGLARGFDTQVGDDRMGSPHAWNAVTIDGEYLLMDATWGAGVCDMSTRSFRKLFRPFFFLLRPNRLIYTHWPENPKQQFLNPPIDEKVFRGLPAIKPESWTLGIKLSGKHRGQVVRTKNDNVEVEVRLKKRPSDGATGKIVARLTWKGQVVPTSIQWLREDKKYVYMVIKCSCPSAGSGELGVFGWPPGGDQSQSGPQCLSYKIINEGTGQAAKPLMKQYAVKGFSFSVMEPTTAQVQKGVPLTIRVRVFDVERGITPAFALQTPEGGMPERFTQVQPGLFEIKKVLTGGQHKIVHMTSEYAFSFAAVFDSV